MKSNSKVQEFEKEFSSCLPTETRLTKSLSDEPELIVICHKMLVKAFPEFDEQLIRTLLLGGKYGMGSIGSTYGDCALHTVYNTIVYYLSTGRWLMGLDKASIEYQREIRLQGVSQWLYDGEKRLTTYIETDNILLACTEAQWHYTGVLIKNEKSVKNFVNAVIKAIKKDEQHIVFDGINIDYEDVEFIGSGFTSSKMKEII